MFGYKLVVLFSCFLLLIFATGIVIADYEVLSGDYGSHDPVMAREDNTYYVFCTGSRIPIRKSTDMHHWQSIGVALTSIPSWVYTYVPGYSGSSVWAPDISYFNGKYHLYHSFSTFGSCYSAIGLATNTTLNPSDPSYAWVDSGGPVVNSTCDGYNAIDPALFIDTQSSPTTYWLSFGSFWGGIKMRQIDPNTGHVLASNPTLYSLAYNPVGDHSIEAPFIIYKDGYYYLFASYDYCCRGTDSTYNIRVGRATSVTGPYYDRNGTSMMSGGGNRLTWNNESWKGPGHNAVFHDNDGRYWFVHHAYVVPSGWSYLRIHELFWDSDGWPTLAEQEPIDVNEAMIAWWNLEEGSGNIAVDLTVNNYDGTIIGSSWITDDFNRGTVLSFDGSDDYVDIPDGFSSFEGLTISGWVYPTAVKSNSRFIDLGNGQADNNILLGRSSSSDKLIFEIYNGTTRVGYLLASDAIELNKWQHFAATVDVCGYSILYKNGLPIMTGITSPPWNVTRTNNYIGRSNWSSYSYYEGRLDDIRIYNKILDANDIYDIYKQGLAPGNCTLVHNNGFGLAADWTEDCYIDFYDQALLANAWLNDFDFENLFDLSDLWLQCNNPTDANCVPNW